jgi:sarcosine oxidase / L-pipecolate oxidase
MTAKTPFSKSSPIIIIGAGVFGLSSAIHLALRGYKDVTILDKQPYEQTLYSYDAGCDAASAGENVSDENTRTQESSNIPS